MGVHSFLLMLHNGGSIDEYFHYYHYYGCMQLIDVYYEVIGMYVD